MLNGNLREHRLREHEETVSSFPGHLCLLLLLSSKELFTFSIEDTQGICAHFKSTYISQSKD